MTQDRAAICQRFRDVCEALSPEVCLSTIDLVDRAFPPRNSTPDERKMHFRALKWGVNQGEFPNYFVFGPKTMIMGRPARPKLWRKPEQPYYPPKQEICFACGQPIIPSGSGLA